VIPATTCVFRHHRSDPERHLAGALQVPGSGPETQTNLGLGRIVRLKDFLRQGYGASRSFPLHSPHSAGLNTTLSYSTLGL
jgi:hypothetical protein